MTLEEAIIHAEAVADRCAVTDGNIKCEMEHRQLAEWLRELQELRRRKKYVAEIFVPVVDKLPMTGVRAMTKKEVIYFLDQVRKILLDDKSWLESTIRPINEAFDMAIKALEQSEPCNDDKGCSNCMYSGRPTYKSPCSECRDNSQWEMKPISRSHENSTECEDTISRQAAIDALKEIKDEGFN